MHSGDYESTSLKASKSIEASFFLHVGNFPSPRRKAHSGYGRVGSTLRSPERGYLRIFLLNKTGGDKAMSSSDSKIAATGFNLWPMKQNRHCSITSARTAAIKAPTLRRCRIAISSAITTAEESSAPLGYPARGGVSMGYRGATNSKYRRNS